MYFRIYPYVKPLKGAIWTQKFLSKLATIGTRRYPYPDKTIMDFNWDSLILLDGCRYDLFKEVIKNKRFKIFGRNLKFIISQGSTTPEWIKNTFTSDYPDVVYISPTPFVSEIKLTEFLGKNPFFYIEPVWKYGWDEKLRTVLAEKVTSAVKRVCKKYKGKRFIIHYFQPHHPFVGKFRLKDEELLRKVLSKKIAEPTTWDFFEIGCCAKEEMWEAYKSNLEYVLLEVKKILRYLRGKVVITSDHGNCFGEYGIYEHVPGLRIEELVKVPWVEIKI